MISAAALTLDISRFPPPVAIRGVTFDALRLKGLELLKQSFTEFGIDWDVERLEANPGAIVNRALSYREYLAYVRINDAVRAVMVLFAVGSDLDNLGIFHRTVRRVVTPATGSTPAVMENDDEFRRRILIAPEAFTTGGAAGAYVYHALSSHGDVLNVDVWTPSDGSGEVIIAVQSRVGDGTASDELVEIVHNYLHRLGENGWPNIKPLTTVVSTRSIVNVPYRIVGQGFVRPGPDSAQTYELSLAGLTQETARRRTPSRDVPLSSLVAAGMAGAMDKLSIIEPEADIVRGRGEVPLCTDIDLSVVTYAG